MCALELLIGKRERYWEIGTERSSPLVDIIRRPSKYRNVRTVYGGLPYDSKAEARRAAELDLMVRAGAIRGWTRQVTFRLGCMENVMRIDFLVWDVDGSSWAEDVKGAETAKFKHDRKLWARYGPCPLHVLKGKASEVIEPTKED